jgi:hypothetical protein
MLARIISGQFYVSTMLGGNRIISEIHSNFVPALIAIAGTAVLLICAKHAKTEMRVLLLFTGMVVIGSLLSPTCSEPPPMTSWEVLSRTPWTRYEFFPALALVWSILWIFHRPPQILKILGFLLLVVLTIGEIRDFRYPAPKDLHFMEYAELLNDSPKGSTVIIPENPSDGGWTIQLLKH